MAQTGADMIQTMDKDPREQEWMRAVQRGDRSAFERLYHHFKQPLARFLMRYAGDPFFVDDLLQEVFVRFWKSAGQFRGESKVSTYLFRIAHRVWLTEGMKRRRTESRQSPVEPANLSKEASSSDPEMKRRIDAALHQLSEGERSVFILSEVEGFRYAEISEILDIPVGTVKSRMSSAVQKLKKALSPPS